MEPDRPKMSKAPVLILIRTNALSLCFDAFSSREPGYPLRLKTLCFQQDFRRIANDQTPVSGCRRPAGRVRPGAWSGRSAPLPAPLPSLLAAALSDQLPP